MAMTIFAPGFDTRADLKVAIGIVFANVSLTVALLKLLP